MTPTTLSGPFTVVDHPIDWSEHASGHVGILDLACGQRLLLGLVPGADRWDDEETSDFWRFGYGSALAPDGTWHEYIVTMIGPDTDLDEVIAAAERAAPEVIAEYRRHDRTPAATG
ncbi:hypothetical protein [Nocardiopsis suaedae]|uniref:MmcQ/YjbR family DNA-binding protein n=1 Tax=Nocardiopsis suaedae TaxID=3018444 RepID=A0ABT4TMZ4_9ACTN|nr:hypothetical protein [Nocardiopsis suaedae]MDA2805731.1 hypothetical protein [Nocardiopsis suaedae]